MKSTKVKRVRLNLTHMILQTLIHQIHRVVLGHQKGRKNQKDKEWRKKHKQKRVQCKLLKNLYLSSNKSNNSFNLFEIIRSSLWWERRDQEKLPNFHNIFMRLVIQRWEKSAVLNLEGSQQWVLQRELASKWMLNWDNKSDTQSGFKIIHPKIPSLSTWRMVCC